MGTGSHLCYRCCDVILPGNALGRPELNLLGVPVAHSMGAAACAAASMLTLRTLQHRQFLAGVLACLRFSLGERLLLRACTSCSLRQACAC
jgi:hypothetical protein